MNYPNPNTDKKSALLSNLFRLTLAAGLLWWLISSGSIKPEYLTVQSSRLPLLLSGAVALLTAMSLSGIRYRELLKGGGVVFPISESMKASAIMYFFTQCVLGPASGDVARFFYTVKRTGNKSGTGAAIMIDRFIGTMGLFMLAGLGMILNWELVESSQTLRLIAVPLLALLCGLWMSFSLAFLALIKNRKTALLLGTSFPVMAGILCSGEFSSFVSDEIGPVLLAVSAFSLLAPVLAPEMLENGIIRKKILRNSKIGEKTSEFISAVFLYRNSPDIILKTVVVTAVQHLLLILSLFLFSLSQNLPSTPDFMAIFFSAPLSFLAGIIPAPAAGLGVNEAAFETLLRLATNETVNAGASVYLMHRIWTTMFSLSGIPFILSKKGKKVAST